MEKKCETSPAYLPTLLSSYRLIERYGELLLQADGDAIKAETDLSALDAYLLQQTICHLSQQAIVVDLAADATCGASTVCWMTAENVKQIVVPRHDWQSGSNTAWRNSFHFAIEAMGLNPVELAVEPFQQVLTEQKNPLFQTVIILAQAETDAQALNERLAALFSLQPKAIVFLLSLGAIGNSELLKQAISFAEARAPYQLIALRELCPFWSTSRLGVFYSSDNVDLPASLRRLQQQYEGNFQFLKMVRHVVESELKTGSSTSDQVETPPMPVKGDFSFAPLNYPILFEVPKWLTPGSAWHEHIPFAMYLMAILRPAKLVELGTLAGDSYCGFCQAVAALELPTQCYAIDTWRGDEHAGFYGEEVLLELRAHHDSLYGDFSSLIQSKFSDALPQFEDGSIDLLHIDGLHTYEAVKEDFEAWLPKMSQRGVVLFHDTCVRENNFGVFRLWEELSAKYLHFEFKHGYGLGVLAVGRKQPEEMRALLCLDEEAANNLRQFFFRLGNEVHLRALVKFQEENLTTLSAQLAAQSGQLALQKEQLEGQEAQLAAQYANAQKIQGSLGWRFLQMFWRLTAKLK